MKTSVVKAPTKNTPPNSSNNSSSKHIRRQRQTRNAIAEYKRSGSPAARETILANHIGLIKFYAGKYADRGIDFDDLFQEGCLGLLAALEGFEPSLGFEFSTYASHFIRGHMRESYRTKAWPCSVPRSVRDMSSQIKLLESKLGHEPTKKDVLDFCDIPPDKVDDVMAAARIWHPACFYHMDASCDINPAILSGSSSFDHDLEETPTRIDMLRLMQETLSSEEYEIVRMRFFEDASQREIAQRLGTHQMHVSRSLQRSIRRLGAALTGIEERQAS